MLRPPLPHAVAAWGTRQYRRLTATVAPPLQAALWGLALLFAGTSPVYAQQGGGGGNCSIPSGLQPLFTLMETGAEILLYMGTGLGVIGFAVAGIMFIAPGQQQNQRGKSVAKNVLIGVVILLLAFGIVQFVVNQLGGPLCMNNPTGGGG